MGSQNAALLCSYTNAGVSHHACRPWVLSRWCHTRWASSRGGRPACCRGKGDSGADAIAGGQEGAAGEAAGLPPAARSLLQPTRRRFEPKKAKVVSQLLSFFLSSACQIPSSPLPCPLILLSLPSPESNSFTGLKAPQLGRLCFCSPRGVPWHKARATLGTKPDRKARGSQGHDPARLPLPFSNPHRSSGSLSPHVVLKCCLHSSRAQGGGENQALGSHSSHCLGGGPVAGGGQGSQGPAGSQWGGQRCGSSQKMVKGSLEPHALHTHTSCLTLSRLLTLGFLIPSGQRGAALWGGCRKAVA